MKTNMKIGSLYLVKRYYWFLLPSKETAACAYAAVLHLDGMTAALFGGDVGYWRRRFNCEVTYFSPDSYIVCLEEDGIYKKVLTSDGNIGWTWFKEEYNDCFEEATNK